MALRTFSNAVNVVCPGCGSVLDATDPKLAILQANAEKQHVRPILPLGTRGRWKGVTYEVVGLQERTINVDGVSYRWHEYLLFNPYAGYRYLTVYEGHWNDVTVCRALPKTLSPTGAQRKGRELFDGRTLTQFQTATATTTFILGEFPWQVRLNDQVEDKDFIAPPFMLSAESTAGETTYSLGEYTPGADIWKAFNMAGSPPPARGVFANQPNPFGSEPKAFWNLGWKFLGAAILVFAVLAMLASRKDVFKENYIYRFETGQEPSFVTPVFELGGHTSNVELTVDTDLDNDWVYYDFALINADTGEAYDFGREVSYYYGTDSDGRWTEGSQASTAIIPSVPPGHYYLRVEPQRDPGTRAVHYSLELKRDIPGFSWFWLALAALIVPPAFISARGWSFEYKRWQESDYPIVTTSSAGGDDD